MFDLNYFMFEPIKPPSQIFLELDLQDWQIIFW